MVERDLEFEGQMQLIFNTCDCIKFIADFDKKKLKPWILYTNCKQINTETKTKRQEDGSSDFSLEEYTFNFN